MRLPRMRAARRETTYRVEFTEGKLGPRGQRPVAPFTIEAKSHEDFSRQIIKRARTRVASRGVDVMLDVDERGYVVAGSVYVGTIRLVGTFTASAQT